MRKAGLLFATLFYSVLVAGQSKPVSFPMATSFGGPCPSATTTIAGGTINNDPNCSWLLNGADNVDALFGARGTGDLHIRNQATETVGRTTISPGTSTISVDSAAGFTTNLGVGLAINAGLADEEAIPGGRWSCDHAPNCIGTTLQITFAKSHTAPYNVSQQGAALVESPVVFQTNRLGNRGIVTYWRVIGGAVAGQQTGTEWGDAQGDSIGTLTRFFANCIRDTGVACNKINRWYGSGFTANFGMILYGASTGSGTSNKIGISTNDADDPNGTKSKIVIDPNAGSIQAATFASTLGTGAPPLTIASTTPVVNLNASLATYNAAGTQIANVHAVKDTVACSSGSATKRLSGPAVFADATYACTCTDLSNAAHLCQKNSSRSTASSIVLTCSGTDSLQFACFGQ